MIALYIEICGGMATEGAAVIFEMKGQCQDMMFGTRNGRRLKVKYTHTEEIKITAPYIPGTVSKARADK